MVIGFNGKMGVGKSEAINALKAYVESIGGPKIRLVKFAQPLYDMQEFIYNRIGSVHTRAADFKKDRKLLQWLGTDWGRETISQNLWVDIWKAEVAAALTAGELPVCDDVRFDNEGAVLKEMGGRLIKIVSDRAGDRINTSAGIANHASEAGVADAYIDFVLENNGSLSQYRQDLAYLFGKLDIQSK